MNTCHTKILPADYIYCSYFFDFLIIFFSYFLLSEHGKVIKSASVRKEKIKLIGI